jgi:hypothetical protein
VLRDAFVLPFIPLNKIKGMPFRTGELADKIRELIGVSV